MSWQAGSLAVIAVGLVVGFWWYEQSRPTSRLLALVATLAALAALGRVAFAPLPNVKPTTDIVLLAGLALGGAPGFVVGAVGALASNLYFGQGPWTPWQMAGWGIVGLMGAGLGAVLPRPGRATHAVAGAAAGVVFAIVMNAFLWVTYSGDHTLAKLGALFATSFPFDVAHVAGNAVFALAFGPGFLAALRRFRARLDVRWVALPAALLLLAPLAAASVPRAPVRYVLRAQNADGGFGGAPGQRSSQLYTGWVALGLAAAGRNPARVSRGGHSILDYMTAHARDLDDLGEIDRTILVLHAAGRDPRRFAGRNLVAEVGRRQRGDGSFDGRVNTTAFAIMGLRAAGVSRRAAGIRSALRWIAHQANGDGGFNFLRRGGQSGIDDTAAVLQALGTVGWQHTRLARRAAAFVLRSRNADGGFPLVRGAGSNAQSTAWAIQGLRAAGRRTSLRYLRTLITSSGAVRYSRTSTQTPVWVTGEALAGLAQRPLPVPRVK